MTDSDVVTRTRECEVAEPSQDLVARASPALHTKAVRLAFALQGDTDETVEEDLVEPS
jgi:hypothetical protein